MLIQGREPWDFPPGTSNLIVPCHLLPFCLRARLSTSPQGHANTGPPSSDNWIILNHSINLLPLLGSKVNLVHKVVCHNLWHCSELTSNSFCHQLKDCTRGPACYGLFTTNHILDITANHFANHACVLKVFGCTVLSWPFKTSVGLHLFLYNMRNQLADRETLV